MRMYLIAAVLVGFAVGVVLGCASSKDVQVAAADGAGTGVQVVAGSREDGNTVFLRYNVQTGESWIWAPGGASWSPLSEGE